jgi:hypothetical protein
VSAKSGETHFGERILGALGLWPLSDAGAGTFKTGRLKEAELSGALLGGCNKDHRVTMFGTI